MPFRDLKLPEWKDLPDFGLYMDQLMTCVERVFEGCALEPLTPGMVNSYVKSGLVERPSGKKYSRGALAQLLMICLLKRTSSLETLGRLLHPEEEDTQSLYSLFCWDIRNLTGSGFEEASPLMAALRAAAWQFRCIELLEQDS